MESLRLKIKLIKKDAITPTYAHPGDAGMDLYSRELHTLERGEPYLFKLGFATEFPKGWVGMVCDRSSMGKRGVRTLGGVIDAHYRGEWGVILINLTNKEVLIKPGEKIAQVLFMRIGEAKVEENEELTNTARGTGGFGSTGK